MIVFIKCRKPSLEIISSHSFSALPPQFPSANPVVCVLSLGSREAPASYHPHPRPPAGAFVSRASTVRLLFLCLRNQDVLLRCPPAGISDAVRLNSKKTRGVCFMGCPFPHRGHTSFPSFPHTFSNFLFDAKHWDAKLCRAFAVLLKVCFVGLFMWQAVESLLEAFEAQESLLSMQLGSLPCRPVCSAWGLRSVLGPRPPGPRRSPAACSQQSGDPRRTPGAFTLPSLLVSRNRSCHRLRSTCSPSPPWGPHPPCDPERPQAGARVGPSPAPGQSRSTRACAGSSPAWRQLCTWGSRGLPPRSLETGRTGGRSLRAPAEGPRRPLDGQFGPSGSRHRDGCSDPEVLGALAVPAL